MMIFKYVIDEHKMDTASGVVGISMPRGAEILTVQTQLGKPVVWARVDPDAPRVTRRLAVFPTGGRADAPRTQYVGTFQLADGVLVFHVFDLGEV